METEIVRILANFGFPALVAGFVLFRLNGKLERLTVSTITLSEKIERLIDKLN